MGSIHLPLGSQCSMLEPHETMIGGGAGGRAPWGAPPMQQHHPNGHHGGTGQPQGWPQQTPLQEPFPPLQFHQPPQQTLIHGRPHAQSDAYTLRQKEEQRRRQLEYSQALAEQVHAREQQKRQDKDARRREDAAYEASVGIGGGGEPFRLDRGLFDGMGQSNPSQRNNFGRGRREPPAVAPPIHQPPIHHAIQPMEMHQHPNQAPTVSGWSGHAEALGLVEPHYPQSDTYNGLTPRQISQWNAGQPPPHQHQQQQQQQQQFQQLPPPGGGRRARTDLHGDADDGHARLRQQQQLDMQEALRRQVEDKQRQKLEEKRQREQEERREMEKFELEKRRQQEEQERLKDEKRRKALADEEHFRAQQQQLQAAAAAAASDHRHHREQRHHEPTAPSGWEQSSPQRNHQPIAHQHAKPPALDQNPFANSRAHLFQDPPSPPRQQPPPPQLQQHNQQQQHYPPHQQQHSQLPPLMDHNLHHDQHFEPRSQQVQPPGGHHHSHAVDTNRLLEQYEQVRVELERQRQLVEQLHWQIQQQQRPSREETAELAPTVSDLERLRQELRDELEQREAQHRDELELLRRQQQLQVLSMGKPLEPQRSTSRLVDHQEPHQHIRIPPRNGPGRRHDAFVQEALDEEDEDKAEANVEQRRVDESVLSLDRQCNQRLSPRALPQRRSPAGEEHRHRRSQSPLKNSMSTSSLQCDSTLVFFDGRVQPTRLLRQEPRGDGGGDRQLTRNATHVLFEQEDEPEDGDANKLDDCVDEPGVLRLRRSNVQSKTSRTDNQAERAAEPLENEGSDEDEDEDALGFFIRRFDSQDAEPERYRSSTQSTRASTLGLNPSPPSSSINAAHSRAQAILRDIEEEDEEDGNEGGSLDGETLETIFQRNVRRHEILSGFEAQTQYEPSHWQDLNRMLQTVPSEVAARRAAARKEPSLTTSSRWMPSSLVH